MSKYIDHKEEIIDLHKKGYSNGAIAAALTKKYAINFDRSRIRERLIKFLGNDYNPNFQFSGVEAGQQLGKKPNAVEEIMGNSGFTNGVDAEARLVWDKSNKNYSVLYKMVKDVMTFDQMQEALKEELKDYTPNIEPIKRDTIKDPHLLVIDIADLHIGKLADVLDTGDTYNHEIAYKRAIDGVEGLLAKASGFPIDKILFILGNDVLHTDNDRSSTTKGTHQDVSQKWFRNFTLARKMYVQIIERLLGFADIHIVHNMSNHDYVSGFMLADAIYCWFNSSTNITWDISPFDRKYFKYGNSLIGTAHGDNGKMDSLPLSMSLEAKEYWSTSKYYYFYLHHIHHKQKYKFNAGKDYQGVSIEYMRSPSGTDSWHSKNQYANNMKAIEAFIHSKEFGQVARLTHLF